MDGDGEDNTGGDAEPDQPTGWQPNDSNTLWGWLDNIVSGFVSLIENIQALPALIGNAIKGFFDDVKNAILSLPTLILDGLKSIFIPDTEDLELMFYDFMEDFKETFQLNTQSFENLFTTEKPIDDVYVDIDIPGVGPFHLKVLDSKYLLEGIAYFRPVIRGFLTLLLLIFTWNNILGLIRQAMPIAPSSPTETEAITVSESKSEKMANGWTRTTTKSSSTRSRR